MWTGDYRFLLQNLILKDYRIRYRNMSLGVFWSLVNPLVMMGVLSLVFTKFFTSPVPNFPLFLLCGIVTFNFFTIAWSSGTTSIVDNAPFIKRVPVPREVFPIASVLSVFIHALIQIGILIALAFGYGRFPNVNWIWLPVIWLLLITFACGLTLMFSAFNVYVRDIRYVVESSNTVLFWLVPIVYPFTTIPPAWRNLYLLNPVTCATIALRSVIVDGAPPEVGVLLRLAVIASVTYVAGWVVFRSLKKRFYNYL
jgi:lipopolysaccharide transport system permease protein